MGKIVSAIAERRCAPCRRCIPFVFPLSFSAWQPVPLPSQPAAGASGTVPQVELDAAKATPLGPQERTATATGARPASRTATALYHRRPHQQHLLLLPRQQSPRQHPHRRSSLWPLHTVASGMGGSDRTHRIRRRSPAGSSVSRDCTWHLHST